MSSLDHIVIATKNAEKAAQSLYAHCGLAAYSGGRLTGLGTESFIVPLGKSYLELCSVYDEREANTNLLGRAVLAATENANCSFLTWAVEAAESMDSSTDRLQITAAPMKRALPDGGNISCNIAGLQQALESPPLPYFVSWLPGQARPNHVDVDHDGDPISFAWIELSGDQQQVSEWLGDSTLPLQWVEGAPPGVHALGIITEGEPIILRSPLHFEQSPHRPPLQAHPNGANEETPATSNQPNVLESILESVEHAVESAAEVVESVAGQLMPPEGH